MIFSSILEKQDKAEIGRNSFPSPTLKIGVTLAVFKSSGKILSSKDNLKICNKDLLRDPKQLLILSTLISSRTGLVFVCREKNASFTSFILKGYSS